MITGLDEDPMEYIKSTSGNTETIQFDITFETVFWDRPPAVDIRIDDVLYASKVIDEPTTISFKAELSLDCVHRLVVTRSGKSDDQCVDNKDQYLLLSKVKIDLIDIKNIVFTRSYFEPVYPEPWATQQKNQGVVLEQRVIGETWLSHNGNWVLEFDSPFYQYLFECMN